MKAIASLIAALTLSAGTALADPLAAFPSAEEIQEAINEGIGLRYPESQAVSNLRIRKGGKTDRGDWVYLCTLQLVWKIDSKQFLKDHMAKAKQEVGKQIAPGALKDLALAIAPKVVSAVLGEFEAGDRIAELPVRVSLILAGEDWIVLDTAFSPAFENPLDELLEKREKGQ